MKKILLFAVFFTSSFAWTDDCIRGDCFNGYGHMIFEDGQVYIGTWINGKKDGLGGEDFTNGDKYDGEYLKGKKHGQGTYSFAPGDVYVGAFKDNKINGKGTQKYINGDVYKGNYLNNQRHGQGTMTWANGNKFTGNFFMSEMSGEGTYFNASGSIISHGIWAANRFLGTQAEIDAQNRADNAKATAARKLKEEAKKKYTRIYNACLIDKSSGIDMQVSSLKQAVEETCEAIAKSPTWYQSFKYN